MAPTTSRRSGSDVNKSRPDNHTSNITRHHKGILEHVTEDISPTILLTTPPYPFPPYSVFPKSLTGRPNSTTRIGRHLPASVGNMCDIRVALTLSVTVFPSAFQERTEHDVMSTLRADPIYVRHWRSFSWVRAGHASGVHGRTHRPVFSRHNHTGAPLLPFRFTGGKSLCVTEGGVA